MKQGIFRALLTVAAVVAPFLAWGKTATVDGVEWSYSVANNAATVTGANPAIGHLAIPSKLGGYGVKAIGDNAFYWCEGLTGVTIPSGVTSIGNYAFSGCSSLTEVTIPEGVKTLGEWSFYWCWRLPQATLPSSVTSIGEYAFSGCQSLTEMTIPENVASIGDFAFNYCTGLTAIAVSSGNSRFASVDGILYNKSKDRLLSCPCGKASALSIPGTVRTIVDGAFSECGKLTEVAIPSGVTNIGTASFLGCSNLVTATLPDSLKRIGESAFAGCERLTGMALPSSLASIGERAFSECGALTEMAIPSGVTSIGDYAFAECGRLPAISVASGNSKFAGVDGILYNKAKDKLLACPGGKTSATAIPGTVKSVAAGAFFYCTNLATVSIPDSVTSFGESAFEGCSALKSVVLPKNLTSIASRLFCRCFGLESVTIPSGVTTIEPWSFNSCESLQSLALPNKLKSIGHKAFEACSGLTELTIPDSVTSIGIWAFNQCSGLTELHIGNGVSKIDEGVFSSCRGLTEIDIPNNVKTIGTSAFSSCYGLTAVTIPAGVTSMGEYAFGWCGNLERFEVAAGNGYFASVDGVLYTKSKDRLLSWPAGKSGICVIPDGVKTIDERAFEECQGLTAVTMPDSLKNIGDVAFADCWNLAAVAIGNGVTNIGWHAFSGCNKLTALALPSSVKCVGDSAFGWGCALETLYVPASWEGTSMLSAASLPDDCRVVYGASMQQVVFDPNGGTCEVASLWGTPGNPYGALPAAARTNQVFAGWHTAAEGGTEVGPEDAATAASARLLYAHWTTEQTVTFDANGGTTPVASETLSIGEPYGTLPTPAWAGHAFLGWFTLAEGGQQVTATQAVTATAARTLYAHWTDKQVTTFKGNGGSPATQKTTNTIAAAYGVLPEAKKSGNAFLGWFTKATGGSQVTANTTVTKAATRTLYAHWTDKQVTTFNGNGGTPEVEATTNTIASAYGPLPEAAWTNHVFKGWYSEPEGGKRVYTNSTVTTAAARTLYAHWTDQQVTTFKGNGGTPEAQKTTNTIGKAYGTMPAVEWEGHALLGWFTTPKGSIKVTSKDKVTESATRNLYAHWTDHQTVTLDANGGTCAKKTMSFGFGTKYAGLPEAQWPGHAFLGWFAAAAGGNQVTASRNVTTAASRTLYAHWTDQQVTTFKGNGGTPEAQKTTNTIGKAYGSMPAVEWEGHVLLGWFTTPKGSIKVASTDKVTESATRNLYAHWTDHQTVTLDANGGTCAKKTMSFGFGTKYAGLPEAQWPGHVFLGWFAAAAGGNQVTAKHNVTAKAARTLYAHWTTEQTVAFAAHGGTCATETASAAIGAPYGTLPVPTWAGHAFQGWFDAAEGGNQVTEATIVPEEANRTLHAQWTTVQTVTFDANGGTCKKTSVACVIGETYTTLASASWEGRKFLGWFDARTGGTRVKIGRTVTEDAERTLYAHWEQIVHFDANGGTCKKTSVACVIGETYTTLATATRAGHKFQGWYDAPEGGKRVKIGMTVTSDAERTLYARWQPTASGAALSISSFSVKPKGTRAARTAPVGVLAFEAEAGRVYEIQWTPALGGEWTALRRWTAETDGETAVPVAVPADSPAGFFRVVEAPGE